MKTDKKTGRGRKKVADDCVCVGGTNCLRGDRTKKALVEAGLEMFSQYGFNATSTRMLARKAGANIAAIPYYFVNKSGLYVAVAEYIAGRILSYIGDTVKEVGQEAGRGNIGRERAGECIRILFRAMASIFVESVEARNWALIIVREQIKPSSAFDFLYENVMRPNYELLSGLFAVYYGCDRDDKRVKIKIHAMLGQFVVFIANREALLRQLCIKKFGPGEIAEVVGILDKHIAACLGAEL